MSAIELIDVSVDIPVYDVGGSSLRRMILGRAVGGRFAQSGTHVVVNALKGISFEAHDGDRIGMVGQNGSGKTTLLRVLSGVYPPTAGSVSVKGRVSPMLDTTLGMADDATGFENVRISGALWGLTRRQLDASMDDIVEFTELGDYLKMPVRTYSQGMHLRLAFAIATLREPDILLLDEVIGVGDAGFYQKAFARLMNLVQKSRILFVASHNNDMIRRLCNKAIWLHKGNLIIYDEVDKVLTAYEREDPETILAERVAAQ
jgi:ABC-type polysaccharide/polyol phosphate transport system ATPase subunit